MSKFLCALFALAVVLTLAGSVLADCNCGSPAPAPTYATSGPTFYGPTYAPRHVPSTYAAYRPVVAQGCCGSTVACESDCCQPSPCCGPYAAYRPFNPCRPGVVGSSIYGTQKVYVPGEPVRNVLRAITP